MARLARLAILILGLVALGGLAGCGGSGSIAVSDAWARPSMGMDRAGAAYLVIANEGDEDDVLLGATSPAAATVEVHETTMEGDGSMAMRPIESLGGATKSRESSIACRGTASPPSARLRSNTTAWRSVNSCCAAEGGGWLPVSPDPAAGSGAGWSAGT